ncbi:recombinase family protein [Kitasatospora sp. NPDC048545]|uniref:recombinase family protein n=1 Tax=Kitasatospora sp. NPDC048545 TaxID=3157208 RepID=UPI0033D5A671
MPSDDEDLIPAIGYIRVSTAREEMISPELQRASIEAWAERRRRRIVHWVVDLDATGRNFRRKIMKAIGYIEDGTAKEIAAWKYSRFGRQRHGNAVNLERLERAGGQLVSSTEEVDARTAIGRFQRGMLLEVAAFESDRAGEQWKETHEWRRTHGLPSGGGRRFGYIWHPRKLPHPDGTFTLQRERYELDPATAPAVAEMYRLYADGAAGFDKIARRLNAAGITTTRGEAWHGESVRGCMDSGFAAGYLRVHSQSCQCEPYLSGCPNHVHLKVDNDEVLPPIISEDLWASYKQRRELVKVTPPRARKPASPFSIILRCDLCGGAMTKGTVGSYSYVRCNIRRRYGTSRCPGVSLPYPAVEDGVLAWLRTIADEINAEADRAADGVLNGSTEEARAGQLAVKVEKLERAVVRHMRAYALIEDDDAALEAEFKQTLAQLRREKTEAATELAEVRGQSAVAQGRASARGEAPALAADLLAEWHSLPVERLNSVLRKVIREVRVTSDKGVAVVPVWAQTAEPEDFVP